MCVPVSVRASDFSSDLWRCCRGSRVPATDGAGDAVHEALLSALGSLSLGIAGTAFCVAVHVRASRVSAERRVAIDALVDRLERLRSDGRSDGPDRGPDRSHAAGGTGTGTDDGAHVG